MSNTRYYVDANGNYLGAFCSVIVLLPRPEDAGDDYEDQYEELWPSGEPENAFLVPSAPDYASQKWSFVSLSYSAAAPPPPAEKVPRPIASAKLTISDGFIDGFAADSAIAGGFAIDVGKFLMFFSTAQPDADYIVNVFDGGLYRCYVQPADYMADSFIVTTTDLAGIPADPACISIIIMRAV